MARRTGEGVGRRIKKTPLLGALCLDVEPELDHVTLPNNVTTRRAVFKRRRCIPPDGMMRRVSTDAGHPPVRVAHHLGLSVRDLDRSIRFYCDVLGTALVRPPYAGDSPAFSGRMAIVALGTTGLDLFEHAGGQRNPFNPVNIGLDHLGFAAESMEELQAWADWLDECGVSHSGIRKIIPGGVQAESIGAMLDFRDPDGIQLEFLFLDAEKIQQSGACA